MRHPPTSLHSQCRRSFRHVTDNNPHGRHSELRIARIGRCGRRRLQQDIHVFVILIKLYYIT